MPLFKYEHRSDALLPWQTFARRLAHNGRLAFVLLLASLGIGVLGYRALGHLPWIDSLLNASMILTGMGPVDRMETATAKLFASFYALFSGVAFLSIMGLLLAPMVHRFLHRFHLEDDEESAPPPGDRASRSRRAAG